MAGELLRVVELHGRTYQIHHGDGRHQIEVLWRVGHTELGALVFDPSFGLYGPGKPVGHTTELRRHVIELRDADRERGIAESREKWRRR